MEPDQAARLRPTMTLLGALAGIAGWLFWDVLYDSLGNDRLFLLMAAVTYGTFFMLLALVGPARFWRSLPWSVGVSAIGAGLLWWASFRYGSVEAFLSAAYPLAGFWLFLVIATPFVAARLRARDGWADYAALFDLSWRIFVRYLAAVLFTVLFWGLLSLSDALLTLVDIRLMSWIWAASPLAWVLTGAVFGLALAVVHELRNYLSPYLVLQLLRLLLPVVLVVVVVFLLALPVQGLSNLVGDLSAAGTLIAAALAAIVLITVTVDRDAADEVQLPWMRGMVQVLALLVPVLAALALYALWLRVGAYGWTPARLMAVTVAGMVLLYGLAYGGAVARRTDWAHRIRHANVGLALLTLAVIVVWLSPALSPERISARDQMARFEARALASEDLPLREMAQQWGVAGSDALEQLRTDPALANRIRALEIEAAPVAPDIRTTLAARIPVQGADPLRAAQLAGLDDFTLSQWRQACDLTVANGPGCALVFGDFTPEQSDGMGVLLLNTPAGGVAANSVRLSQGRLELWGYTMDLAGGTGYDLSVDVLEAVHAGTARLASPDIKALIVGGHALFPHN